VVFGEIRATWLLWIKRFENNTDPLSVCQEVMSHKLKNLYPDTEVAKDIIKLRGKAKNEREMVSAHR